MGANIWPMSLSRREFVAGLSAAGAFWVAAAAACRDTSPDASMHMPDEVPAAGGPPPDPFLTPAQAADVEAITARIFPTDETPGAREAGVVHFIDRTLATGPEDQRAGFVAGLEQLGKDVASRHPGQTSFAALTDAQQDALLTAIETTPFFGQVRFATIAGMFALPKYGGNRDLIGWALVGQDGDFDHKPPFGWYDRPENQRALLGEVL